MCGAAVLVAYGFIPTLQPTDNFGRIFAVYGKLGHAGARILLPHHTSRHLSHSSYRLGVLLTAMRVLLLTAERCFVTLL